MMLANSARFRRRGMAAVVAAAVVAALVVVSSVPPWATAQLTASPAGASAREQMMGGARDASSMIHGYLRDNKGGFIPIDVPRAAQNGPSGSNKHSQIVGNYQGTGRDDPAGGR